MCKPAVLLSLLGFVFAVIPLLVVEGQASTTLEITFSFNASSCQDMMYPMALVNLLSENSTVETQSPYIISFSFFEEVQFTLASELNCNSSAKFYSFTLVGTCFSTGPCSFTLNLIQPPSLSPTILNSCSSSSKIMICYGCFDFGSVSYYSKLSSGKNNNSIFGCPSL